MSLGWGGAAHDARVFRNSKVSHGGLSNHGTLCAKPLVNGQLKLEPERFFSGGEFLLEDSAYRPFSTIIPAYQEKVAHLTASRAERKRINRELSKKRVTVEHTFDMLKSRFQSLRGLRHIVDGKRTFKLLLAHIRARVVLHNILIGCPDDMFWEDFDLVEMQRQWEVEAQEIRDLIERTAQGGDFSFFTEEEEEDKREALRFWFQSNEYKCPYAPKEDGLGF